MAACALCAQVARKVVEDVVLMGSHGHSHPLTDSRLQSSGLVRGFILLFLVVGAAAAFYGFSSDATRTWGALLFNFFFFYSIAVLGLAFAGMQEVVRALSLSQAFSF